MCGFAGLIALDQISEYDERRMAQIVDELRMRGGDGQGVWLSVNRDVMLVHSRLAIQDATSRGGQPYDFGGLTVVFNGEIYNAVELRSRLASHGYTMQSMCDTEVLIKAYHKWGRQAVALLNGDFAFAIHDSRAGELILGRDRFGMKPLYYRLDEGACWFGSYLPAMIRHVPGGRTVDPESLHCYLCLQGVLPLDRTPFREYRKVPPGHFAVLKAKPLARRVDYVETCYYRPQCRVSPPQSEEMIVETVRSLLIEAVKRCLVGNVEPLVWLSGGLDSSLIAAIMTHEIGCAPSTLAVGFDDDGGESGSEFFYSRQAAAVCRSRHEEIDIPTDDVLAQLYECMESANEPMTSNDHVGHYLLARASAARRWKCSLTGLGGDEFWYGYRWQSENFASSCNDIEMFLSTFRECSHGEIRQVLCEKYCLDDHTLTTVAKYYNSLVGNAFDKSVCIDIGWIMPEDPVKRADSSGMRHAVEVRAPFLDVALADYSLSLPAELKLKQGIGKYLLKKVAEKYFEREFVYRPKGHFSVPAVKHTTGSVLEFSRSILLDARCFDRGIIRPDALHRAARRRPHVTQMGGNQIWQLVCLEIWMRQFD